MWTGPSCSPPIRVSYRSTGPAGSMRAAHIEWFVDGQDDREMPRRHPDVDSRAEPRQSIPAVGVHVPSKRRRGSHLFELRHRCADHCCVGPGSRRRIRCVDRSPTRVPAPVDLLSDGHGHEVTAGRPVTKSPRVVPSSLSHPVDRFEQMLARLARTCFRHRWRGRHRLGPRHHRPRLRSASASSATTTGPTSSCPTARPSTSSTSSRPINPSDAGFPGQIVFQDPDGREHARGRRLR